MGPWGLRIRRLLLLPSVFIDVADGRMLWKAAFDKTQRSLSEDIRDARAFFQKGAKWLTANELARYGVNEIFKKFPR